MAEKAKRLTIKELIERLREFPEDAHVSYPDHHSTFGLHYGVCEVVTVQFPNQKPFVALRWVDPESAAKGGS